MEINEEKRKKFMEFAGKRVNNVMHDIQILEPMARSSSYDFTKEDIEKMFFAMQDSLDTAKEEFEKKFEEKAKKERKSFSFDSVEVTTIPQKSEVEQEIANFDTANENVNVF
jgi:hypothetical protein